VKLDIPEISIISKNHDYIPYEDFYEELIEGEPIILDNNNSIGYNINLPKGDVKGILVEVYGGGSNVVKPRNLDEITKFLLSKNTAVITLNLVDLLKLKVHQLVMPEDLHEEVHASINAFYQIIHNKPETLHPSLECLKNKKIFLYGTSFGGMNTERHAEKYPNTFNGYISLNGALSIEMIEKSDIESNRNYTKEKIAGKYLCPQNIKLNDDARHLIIHNLNDSNVNPMVSIDYYANAKKADKNLEVLFNSAGDNSKIDIVYTGHFLSKNKTDFDIISR
jgi:hypothetical protein